MAKMGYMYPKDGFVRQLEELTSSVHQIFEGIFEAFLRHRESSLAAAEQHREKAEQMIKDLTKNLLAIEKREDEGLDRITMLELVKYLEQIGYGTTKLGGSAAAKIKDGVLFSDKAVMELKDIFGVVIESLKNISDLVVTGNQVIAKHLMNRAKIYSEVIREYATEHEDRLIRGICLPKSSILYLSMLDTLKDVLWNIKAIGEVFISK